MPNHTHPFSREEIAEIDQENVLGSIEALADQVTHAWKATQNITFKPTAEIHNVVVVGMGGSALGAHVIKTLFKADFKVPFDFVNSYTLPGYVNEHTLVILSSYSGGTEEVLTACEKAQDAKAQIMVICAGGELAKTADAFHYPIYLIEPKFNPSNQPRMAIGYAVFGMIALLSKAGIISVSKEDVEETIKAIDDIKSQAVPEVDDDKNPAKQLAFQLFQLRPILVAAEHLEGASHVSANQMNENAKAFADFKVIPELNHHLMEGLKYPDSISSTHVFVFINSEMYSDRNQKRFKLTRDIVEQNGIGTYEVKLHSTSKIAQVFESITLFAFAGFYLCMLERVNPAPIPFVDWFKDELGKN